MAAYSSRFLPAGKNLLALTPGAAPARARLAELLWPDTPVARGRRLLSDALYDLRRALGEGWLAPHGDALALEVDGLWVDLWDFDKLIAEGSPAALARAVALYNDDLLTDCYDEWAEPHRRRRHDAYLRALETLATGAPAESLAYARRLVAADPLREDARRTLMVTLGRLDRHAEALATYEDLRRTLQAELGIDPTPATRALAEALLRELSARPTSDSLPFAGRAAERRAALVRLEATLEGQGGAVVVEGEGGLGKTRLLSEVAAGARWRGALVLQAGVDRAQRRRRSRL